MECSMKDFGFEDAVESLVLQDAILFYNTRSINNTSRFWLENYAEIYNRDFEEAQLIHNVLFPYAYKYVGEIENIKRNAI